MKTNRGEHVFVRRERDTGRVADWGADTGREMVTAAATDTGADRGQVAVRARGRSGGGDPAPRFAGRPA